MRKISSLLLAIIILVSVASFTGSKASAQELVDQGVVNQESFVQDFHGALNSTDVELYSTYPNLSETPSDSVSPLSTKSNYDLTLKELSNGNLEGNWTFETLTGRKCYAVMLNMTLQYKKHWYDISWQDVDTWAFNYTGSYSNHEHNQHTWTPIKGSGQYRVKLAGQVKWFDVDGSEGGSPTISYSGGITI